MSDMRVKLDSHLKDPSRSIEDQEKIIESVSCNYEKDY